MTDRLIRPRARSRRSRGRVSFLRLRRLVRRHASGPGELSGDPARRLRSTAVGRLRHELRLLQRRCRRRPDPRRRPPRRRHRRRDGLFNVSLGGGKARDGSGPGKYTSLSNVFRDYGDVWMEITVGGEALFPRVKIQSSAYALNASNLNGKAASSPPSPVPSESASSLPSRERRGANPMPLRLEGDGSIWSRRRIDSERKGPRGPSAAARSAPTPHPVHETTEPSSKWGRPKMVG